MAELADGPVRLCLPVAQWPEADRAAWTAAHRRGGLLDDDGLAASWSRATDIIIGDGYGRFLSYVAETEGLDPTASPQDRVTRPRVEAYVDHLRERNHSSTIAGRILQLGRAVAVMAPHVDWAWLRRMLARLRRMATPARDDRARLMPALTLLDLATTLIRRAETETALSPWRRALLSRDGVMLVVLCALSPRARNVADLSIGTSLQRRGDEWWIDFGPGETKNGRPLAMPLPDTFTGHIERYIAHHRPELVRRSPVPVAGDALWISDGGRPLTAKKVGQVISAVTKRELGRALNPHLFRKIIPTELAIRDPAHVAVAQPLLGHADDRTTQQTYNLGRAIDAARRHHAVVQSIRAGAGIASRVVKRARNQQEGSRGDPGAAEIERSPLLSRCRGSIPQEISRQADMLPAQRRRVGQQRVGHRFPRRALMRHGVGDVEFQ
jgi:site-specific recombinase XerD